MLNTLREQTQNCAGNCAAYGSIQRLLHPITYKNYLCTVPYEVHSKLKCARDYVAYELVHPITHIRKEHANVHYIRGNARQKRANYTISKHRICRGLEYEIREIV